MNSVEESIQESNFNWGDPVKIKECAPIRYRPGSKGCICGIRTVDSVRVSLEFDAALKSELYLVEFGDGKSLEIPKIHLSMASNEPHLHTDHSIT